MPQLAGMPLFQNLDIYRTIGENIKNLRREIPMTQIQFAELIGICNESLSKIESGKNRIEYALILVIAGIFEVNTDVLATKDGYRQLREEEGKMDRIRSSLNISV